MKVANIAELKNKLSAYLDLVKAGETILIMDRNKPIARIEPTSAQDSLADHLNDLEKRGLLRRGKPLKDEFNPLLRPPIQLPEGVSLLEALLAEREENRY